MIKNIWRPKTKVIDNKQVVIYYIQSSLEDFYRSGSSNLKVIYTCDNEKCKKLFIKKASNGKYCSQEGRTTLRTAP